ncbi:hypothetical protein [Absidia glauca]|uniref:RRM domain-containing protein n=1 Tax=Absidia glauca TaxID=4829 RepID=A0A168KZQ3_ABSGL|nr:hypothetical protein [Absidia glauca]
MDLETINNGSNVHNLLFSSSSTSAPHPLSSSPATNGFFQTGTALPSLTDDVTTIFVVGFPEDMTEREFQNMFMFCRGFEAASLKWHCKDQEDDNSVGSNSGKKQMIGFARFRTRLEAMEAADILGGKKVDQDKGTVLKAEMAKKNLHVKRGSVAPTSTSGLLPATLLQQQHQLPLIGSPTSSTTPPWANSTAIIPGESGSLSSTTGTTNTDSIGETANEALSLETTDTDPIASTGGRNSLGVGGGTMSLLSKKLGRYPTTAISGISSTSNGPYDAFSPLPSDLLSPADYKTDPFLNDSLVSNNTPATPVFSDSWFGNAQSNSFDGRHRPSDISLMSPPSRHFGSLGGGGGGNNNGMMAFNQASGISSSNILMGPSPLSKVNNFANHHPPQPQQQYHHPYQMSPSPFNTTNDGDPYDYLSKSTPVSNDRPFGTSPIFDDMMSSRMGSLTMQLNTGADLRSPSVSSNNNNSQQQHYHRPSNPADQNPPCNTLYVGNLPPNTNEDELNDLFSKLPGYKRMCFRNKPQGPMCFVEFDDVLLATNALNELQGYGLTTSVKGGIRLSFSKNPLFIKGPGGPFFTPNNGGNDNNNNNTL